MSVKPGTGGQTFIAESTTKIKLLVKHIANNFPNLTIAVDGGINDLTAHACISAGANYLVAGSYLLNSGNTIKTQVDKLFSHE